jgi:type II secretory pathway component PulC
MKKSIDMKTVMNALVLGFKKMSSKKRASDAVATHAAHVEGKLFRFWCWILPLLLGGVFGWFGMVCLEIGLDGYVRRFRPAAAAVFVAGTRNFEIANMTAFLKSNPFKITPMALPEPEETSTDAPQQITGSLAAAVVRWTMPDIGVLLEDQGNQHMVLVNESFDVYTLEEVTYREAIFVKDENRVVKELLYKEETATALPSPSASVAQNRAADFGPQVVPADPSSGSAGEINRDMINGLMENPFDELKKVRLRPAADEQGLQIQWINKDSVLAQLGVQKGDVIRSINGIAFRNMMDITNSVSSLMNSDRFDVEVMRNGTPTSLQYVVR